MTKEEIPTQLEATVPVEEAFASANPSNEPTVEGFDREMWAEVMMKVVQTTKYFANEY